MADKGSTTKDTAKTTPSGEATTGNVGLSEDAYADDRAITEKSMKTQEQWDEAHAAPDEVFTPEQKKAMKEGEKAQEAEAKAREAKADLASHPEKATDQTTSENA